MFNPQPSVNAPWFAPLAFNIASVASQFFSVLRRDCFGQHRYTPYVYIYTTIYKEQMQTKYSDAINFYSFTAGYCCSLDPPLYCPGLYRPCFAFLLWLLIIVDSQVVPCNTVYLFSLQLESAEEVLYVLLPITLLR